MTNLSEKTIERYLLVSCRTAGFLCLKFVSPTLAGVPDRVIITPTNTVFVEIKRPGQKPTTKQTIVHRKMRRFGASVFVVDNKPAIDQLIQCLKQSNIAAN